MIMENFLFKKITINRKNHLLLESLIIKSPKHIMNLAPNKVSILGLTK